MHPTNRGTEEYGHDDDGHDDGQAPRRRPPRDPITHALGQGNAQRTPALARTVQLVSGDYLLTVNPVDGSEIELCTPGERPGGTTKLTPDDRAELDRAARPPVPPGPAQPRLPLLERQEERERLARLLARGRSVRLTGPSGSGRTTLLDALADDCADLAPDGVVRLSGHRRTVSDLLHELFAAVHSAPLYRPKGDELLALVREIGAVVVLDDVEFGGSALDELLDATPECAFLISATPEVAAPSADSLLEEVFLGGLGRADGLELLERAVGRVLTDDEANWAGDLWFESEGLPLRFVQAGALLRQRDQLRADPNAFDEIGELEDAPVDARFDAEDVHDAPLPSLAEVAAPAALLASRLSDSARTTLRFAVALRGEVPHQAHLPALIGDTHADAALAELVGCALVTPAGSHHRLAAGVLTQLEAAGYASDAEDRARTAARHYAWWAGHPSVTPERVVAEADAVLAALTALVQVTSPKPSASPPSSWLGSSREHPYGQGGPASSADEGEASAAVRLARAAAPGFAVGLHWSAWERALRAGSEAARLAGEVSDQAYFHHELGILALCDAQLDRARAELEASIGLRGALADKRGMVAGRRALALVADPFGHTPSGVGSTSGVSSTAGEEVPGARHEESASPPGGVPAAFCVVPPVPSPQQPGGTSTLVTHRTVPSVSPQHGGVKRLMSGARRNLVATGAGALLAAVLGTVVTLGATSNNDDDAPAKKVGVTPSASAGEDGGGPGADESEKDGGDSDSTNRPADPGEDGLLGTSDDPTPSSRKEPSDHPSSSKDPSDPADPTGPADPTDPGETPTKPSPSRPTDPPTSEPPTDEPTTPPTSEPPTDTPPSSPETSDSAGGPVSSAPASRPAESSGSASGPANSEAPGSTSGSGTTDGTTVI